MIVLTLTLFDAYSIRAGDIFTDISEELFLDSSEDELPVYEEASGLFPASESPPNPEASTDTPAEVLRSFHYEDSQIDVTLTETEPWNIPENLNFSIIPGQRNDFMLFTFLFTDTEGNTVQPTGKAQIVFTFKNTPLSGGEMSDTQETMLFIPYGKNVELLHLKELSGDSDSTEASLTEPAISEGTEETVTLEFTETDQLHRAVFTTPYLDNVAFVWKESDWEHTPDEPEASCGQSIPALSEEVADAKLTEEPAEEEVFEAGNLESETEFQDAVIEEMNAKAALAAGDHTSILDKIAPVQEPNNEWQIVSGQYGSTTDDNWKLQTTTDEGKLFRFQKAVIPTEVENEFLVYLNAEPRMWRLSEWENDVDIWILGSNSGINGELIYLTDPNDAASIKNESKGGSAARLCGNENDALRYSTGKKPITIHTIQLLDSSGTLIRVFSVNLVYATTQGSESSFTILVSTPSAPPDSNGGYPYTHFTNVLFKPDYKNATTGTLQIPSIAADMPGTYNSMYAKDIPKTITNIPDEYFEILEVIDSTSPQKPVVSSDGSLIWDDFSNPIKSSNAEDFEEISENGDIYVYRKNAYELLYRVRLKTEAEDFRSSAEKVFSGNGINFSYSVIDTKMTEMANTENSSNSPPDGILPLQFPSPQVRGLLYNIQYKKTDEFEEPLPGVSFTAVSASPDYTPPETSTAVSDADGLLKFTDLSRGIYSVTEAVPPGYQQAGSPPGFTVCYTTDRDAFVQDGANALYNRSPEENPVTNTILRTNHTVNKVWIGGTEESLDVTLNAALPADAPEDITPEELDRYLDRFAFGKNGQNVNFTEYSYQTLTADSFPAWTYTWEELPANYIYRTEENGTFTLHAVPIVYTVTETLSEDAQAKYTPVTEEREDGSITVITNTVKEPVTETTTHTVKKVWTDETKKEDSLEVELKACYTLPSDSADESDSPDFTAAPETPELTEDEYASLLPGIERTRTLTESGIWEYTWENLPTEYIYLDSDGTAHTVPLSYTAEEHLPPKAAGDYITSTAESPDGLTTTITNSPVYELPSAGGPGIFRFFGGGVLMMMTSVYLAFHGQTNSRKGRCH